MITKKLCILCENSYITTGSNKGFCLSCYFSNMYFFNKKKKYRKINICRLCGDFVGYTNRTGFCRECFFSNRASLTNKIKKEKKCILCGDKRTKTSHRLCLSCHKSNYHYSVNKQVKKQHFCILCKINPIHIKKNSKSFFCKGCFLSNHVFSELTRKKISEFRIGKSSGTKNKKLSQNQKDKISATRKLRKVCVKEKNPNWKGGPAKCFDCGKELRNKWTKRCLSCQHKDLIRNRLRLGKNKCETFLEAILERITPKEYKYVGDAKFWIEHYNPDFININGQKKIIEFFGDYWHNKKEYIERDAKKIKLYRKYGYDCLVIWGKDLKKQKTINRILKFNSKVNPYGHLITK